MKVICANNYYYLRGGSDKVFFNEMELLKAYGHEVAPFSMHHEQNLQSAYAKFFSSPIAYGHLNICGNISAGMRMLYSHDSRKKISALMGCFNPDIIHAHIIHGRLTSSIIDAAQKKRKAMVMTLHEYKLLCPSYLMVCKNALCERCKGKNFYFCLIQCCHKGAFMPSLFGTIEAYVNAYFRKYAWIKFFICPSKFIMKKHAELGIPEEKLTYIPNFVESRSYQPIFGGGKYILFIGRISKEKGIFTLIKAVKDIDVEVKIVGEGPMKTECEAYIRANKITNIVFEGYRSGEELRSLFQGALFLILPSEWYENAPMAVLESFAYGKPVIGSDIGGIPELITEHETGLLFKPADHRELGEKIRYLLSRPSLIATMGSKAREKVEQKYNAQAHYEKLINLYQRAQNNG